MPELTLDPELTLCMVVRNHGHTLGDTLAHILQQQGVDFELLVVDDGSQDNTVDIVRSTHDPRIKLLRHEQYMGTPYGYNAAIEHSSAPFVAFVTPANFLLPGVLKVMVDILRDHSNLGVVYGFSFYIDDSAYISKDTFRKGYDDVLNGCSGDDARRVLLLNADSISPVRIYKRELFETVGNFNKQEPLDAVFELDLRIAARYELKILPAFLSYSQSQGLSPIKLRFQALRKWCRRLRVCHRVQKCDPQHFLNTTEYRLSRLAGEGLYRLLGFSSFQKLVMHNLRKYRRDLRECWSRIPKFTYTLVTTYGSWWPIGLVKMKPPHTQSPNTRIAYYLWRFPTLSQTFIRREVTALRNAGLVVEVVADAPDNPARLDEHARGLIKTCHYLSAGQDHPVSSYWKPFVFHHPLRLVNLFIYVVTHTYAKSKHFREDIRTFSKAVHLAGVLSDKGIDHIHAPWADKFAFIALLASRLLGVPFTVQARAGDIHRVKSQIGLRDRLDHAQCIITNSHFNAQYLKKTVHRRDTKKIQVIYNGIDLQQFQPERCQPKYSNRIRLLSVGRLVEQKGLIYLLKACKILVDRGYEVICEIIGGSEEPGYTACFLQLQTQRLQLGLETHVSFLGAQPFDNVLQKYKSCDIFILPCVRASDGDMDITPNALIEAMAMALPVISTPISAITEIIDDGKSGLLVPPHDEHALSEAIRMLIEDSHLRKKLGKNARKQVQEKFDIEKNSTDFINIFKNTNISK